WRIGAWGSPEPRSTAAPGAKLHPTLSPGPLTVRTARANVESRAGPGPALPARRLAEGHRAGDHRGRATGRRFMPTYVMHSTHQSDQCPTSNSRVRAHAQQTMGGMMTMAEDLGVRLVAGPY